MKEEKKWKRQQKKIKQKINKIQNAMIRFSQTGFIETLEIILI